MFVIALALSAFITTNGTLFSLSEERTIVLFVYLGGVISCISYKIVERDKKYKILAWIITVLYFLIFLLPFLYGIFS